MEKKILNMMLLLGRKTAIKGIKSASNWGFCQPKEPMQLIAKLNLKR